MCAFLCCYFCEVGGVFLMEVLLCVPQDVEHGGARAAPLHAGLLLSCTQLQAGNVNTLPPLLLPRLSLPCCFSFGCWYPAEACLSPILSARVWVILDVLMFLPCLSWTHNLIYLDQPVTCSTFFQKCKAVLAKNTHIKCSRSRGHSSKMLINFENLTQPGHETEGRTFVVGTDFQKFTTVLFLAGVCADVARQLRGRCRKQEALLMGP